MRVLARVTLIAALVLAVAALVVWLVDPAVALEALGLLVLATLVCGLSIIARLVATERTTRAPSTEEWATISRRLGHGVGSVQESTRRAVVRDVGALLTLHELVDVHGETPAHAPWVATPETVLALVGYVAALPDGAVVLDIGSGLSTVWMGLAAQQQNRGIRVIALDHDESFAAATRDALARQGIGDAVSVRCAPLATVRIGDSDFEWYAAETYEDLSDIRLVFVDGPPGSTDANARFPALPQLAPKLADGALLVLDDTNRSDEKRIVREWTTEPITGSHVSVVRELDHSTVLRFERSA